MTSILPLPGDNRKTAKPLSRPKWWDMYEKAQKKIWFSWDVSYTDEYESFCKLDLVSQNIVKNILGFFANSDKLVNENIEERFSKEIGIYEASCMYTLQEHMENVHNTVYSELLFAIIHDDAERQRLLNASETIPSVRAMAEWIRMTASSDELFATRLLRMCIVEGVFFISAFCYIYWLASEGKMPGLAESNELIQRDEMIHTAWGAELYLATTQRPTRAEIEKIIVDGVNLAQNFAKDVLGEDSRLNPERMCRYVEKVADDVLRMIGEAPYYGSKCEFDFMLKAEMKNQTDFFHRQPTEYTMSLVDSGAIDEEI